MVSNNNTEYIHISLGFMASVMALAVQKDELDVVKYLVTELHANTNGELMHASTQYNYVCDVLLCLYKNLD